MEYDQQNIDYDIEIKKIAYIVPNNRLADEAKLVLKDEIAEGWLDVIVINQEIARDNARLAREYERFVNAGYGCIVARGGTYRVLRSAVTTVPVIEEKIRTSDILEALALQVRQRIDDSAIYVVIHSDIADGFENITSLTELNISVTRYSSLNELTEVINNIPEESATVLSGGLASELSERADLKFVEIRNRPHSIRGTAKSAWSLVNQMQENIVRTNVISSIYNNIDEGIVIFRTDNTIEFVNARGSSLLDIEADDAVGMDIYDLIDNMPDKKGDGTCSISNPTTFTSVIGSRSLNVSVYPFEIVTGITRYMVIIQDITKIQEAEHKIRMRLSKKGLVAERTFKDILTEDDNMKRVIEKAKKVSNLNGSVLIYGESGTGKELFAQSIHNASARKDGPFVAINCGALSESLLESELFGYVGGSFTGARKEGKAGVFELAHNGTIFLDEINSTSPSMQTKILRVLEEHEVMRVGSDYVIPVDIRVISASNTNLKQDVEEGKFRRDLFYRLNTFQITIPPMRERIGDAVMLFKYYLKKNTGRNIELSPEFEAQILKHKWLGNVRELRSVALRYDAFDGDNSRGDILDLNEFGEGSNDTARHLDAPNLAGSEHSESERGLSLDEETIPLAKLSDVVERLVIESLENKGLTKSEIADAMGISRQALYKKLKQK